MDHQPEQRKHGPTVPGRGQDRSGKEQVPFILRLALVLGMVSAYAVGFSPLYRLTGSGMWAALAILPVIAAAWFWGLGPALLAALLCSLLSSLLVSQAQPSHWGVVGQALLVSLTVYVPAGAVVGRLHDLGERLRDQIPERKRAEEALRESEELYRALVETSPDAISLSDLDTIILVSNQRSATLLGFETVEEIIGKRSIDFLAPEDRQRAMDNARRTIEEGIVRGVEYTFVRKDGTRFPGELSAALIVDAQGKPKAFMALIRDIAERKRAWEALAESEAKWRTLALTAPAVILTIDRDGMIQFLNRAVGEYTPEQAVGTSAYDYVSPDQRKTMRSCIEQVIETGQPGSYEILGAGPQGPDTACYETHLGPVLYEDQVTAVTLVSTDITERKRAEEQRRRYAVELERANQELKDFTYIVSHDLRAPLINLRGFAGELRRALGVVRDVMKIASPYLGEEQRQALTTALQEYVPEALEFIDASATRMDQLIRALLKLSRVGRRDLNLTPIDMDALVEDSLQTLAHQIEEGQVQVTVAPLPQVVADRTSMEQIMGNLLSNAINYLDRDRPGEIEVSGERNQEETTFRVRDNGRGISEDDMDKVFAPFRRAGRQDRPGEGMALAYVQALVRRHGGRIWCESELAAGTTFTFTIPNRLEKGGDHE